MSAAIIGLFQLTFNDNVASLSDSARVGDVVEGLSQRVGSLIAGGRMYTADPTSIGNVYLSISAEQ